MPRELAILRYLPVAKSAAKTIHNLGIDREDLYQEAALGVINAVDKFDSPPLQDGSYPDGCGFVSYMRKAIRFRMIKFIWHNINLIKWPERLMKDVYLANHVNDLKHFLCTDRLEEADRSLLRSTIVRRMG